MLLEIFKYTQVESVQDCKKCLAIFTDFIFGSMLALHKSVEISLARAEAKLVLHQVFLKTLCVNQMLNGVSYEKGDVHINTLIDYSSILSIVRDVYNLLLVAELVFICPDSEEKKIVMFDLFKIQGLKERQKYECTTNEHKEQCKFEREEIEKCIDEIRNTQFYTSLDVVEKNKIDNFIDKSRYRVMLDDNNIRCVGYKELWRLCGVKNDSYDMIYSFLSLHAHTSHISLMQLEESYGETKSWKDMTCSAVLQLIILLSILIADYCKLFPLMKEYYMKQSDEIRFAIDINNTSMRGKDFSIDQDDFSRLIKKVEAEIIYSTN